jgi:hypothetical protein
MAKSEVRAGLYQDDKSVEFAGTKIIEKLDVSCACGVSLWC